MKHTQLLDMWVAVPTSGFVGTDLKLMVHPERAGAENEASISNDLNVGKFKAIRVIELMLLSSDSFFEFKVSSNPPFPKRPRIKRAAKSLQFSTAK